jgi:hypothetical protein
MRGTYENVKHDGVTRRRVLHHSLVAGVGLGVTPLLSLSSAAAQSRTGGHVVILNYAYFEVWDPHLAGTLAANAAISPMYNQVVEFNPIKPQEIIGDLAKSWEVTDSGTTYNPVASRPSSRTSISGWKRRKAGRPRAASTAPERQGGVHDKTSRPQEWTGSDTAQGAQDRPCRDAWGRGSGTDWHHGLYDPRSSRDAGIRGTGHGAELWLP